MNELEQFSLLLDSGLDNKTMIEISFKEHKKIIDSLQQGNSLINILSNQKGKSFETFRLLSKYLSLKDILNSIQNLSKSTSSLVSKFLKDCVYPAFMFLFSYLMILFFSHILLPAMKEYTDSNSYLIMYALEFFYSFLIIAFLFIFLFRKKILTQFKIAKQIMTIRFAILLESLLKISLPTNLALEILSQYSYIKDISIPLYQGMQKGKTFIEVLHAIPLLDTSFIPLFQIGLETNTIKLLQIYIQKTTSDLSKEIKKISIVIQIVSYFSVGLMVLLVYRIMLMPLNMLNTM